MEESRFQPYGGGIRADRAGSAAHDSCQRKHARIVGDDQHVGFERELLTIEQNQALTGLRHAHGERTAEPGGIEGMQRLAGFEHDVIGHIDYRPERAYAAARQALRHPGRRRGVGAQAADHLPAITRAGGGVLDLDAWCRQCGLNCLAPLRQRQLATGQRSHLARDAQYAKAIAAIGRQFQGKNLVV